MPAAPSRAVTSVGTGGNASVGGTGAGPGGFTPPGGDRPGFTPPIGGRPGFTPPVGGPTGPPAVARSPVIRTIHPHPGADRLDLAQVGLYRAVVAKGAFRTGEHALYIPEQSILPPDLIAELGLTGRLRGGAANRVGAVRLRGELSQGIVCRPSTLGITDWAAAVGTDHAAALGITKWVPPIPPQLTGKAIPAPDVLTWVDIEHLQRYPDVFTTGEPVVVTEKIHGSCMVLTVAGNRTLVSSKSQAAQRVALEEDPLNLYWRAVHRLGIDDAARAIAEELGADRVAIYGEVYGAGVQDLAYGADARRPDGPGYVAFDLRIEVDGRTEWVDAPRALALLAAHGLPVVPVLFEGPFDLDAVLAAATGATVLGERAHLREGVVVRPARERFSTAVSGRAIAKVVSPAYLTRGGDATEYE